jgi:hypothetical protein
MGFSELHCDTTQKPSLFMLLTVGEKYERRVITEIGYT